MSNLETTLQKIISENTRQAVAAVSASIAQLLSGGLTGKTAEAPVPKAAKADKPAKAPKAKGASKHKGRAANPKTLETALAGAKFIALNPGSKAGPIAAHLKIDVKNWLGPSKQALSHGWITKTGERASTTYYPGNVPTELPTATTAPAAAAPAGNAGGTVMAPSFASFPETAGA